MTQAMNLALPHSPSIGTFDTYVNAISRLPILDQEREQELARRFRDDGDLSAARELVMANLRFVVHLARGYAGYGLPLPDVVQEGNIGLMKAVKRFDPDMGVRLVSFAVHWIRAEIHEYIIKNWRIVKIATTKAQRKLFFNLRKSKKHLGWLSKKDAEALAKDLNVQLKTVYEMESGWTVSIWVWTARSVTMRQKIMPRLFIICSNKTLILPNCLNKANGTVTSSNNSATR